MPNIAEVSAIGGFVKEYNIDVIPAAMERYGISLGDIVDKVQYASEDIGAGALEINQVEYFVRAIGTVKHISDINNLVIKSHKGTPILLADVAHVQVGPAERRGILDKEGSEAVGAIVAAQYKSNAYDVLKSLKECIKNIATTLPVKTLDNGVKSRVTVVPFYDRSPLIERSLNTLEETLESEILITILVIVLMLMHLNQAFTASLLISSILPFGVLGACLCMRVLDIEANIVATAGIAIAIGTMVDMGIVFVERILQKLDNKPYTSINVKQSILSTTKDVGNSLLTAFATTILSFLPILTMEAAEGKLFKPLAYTKTLALLSAMVITFILLPFLAHLALSFSMRKQATLLYALLGICLY